MEVLQEAKMLGEIALIWWWWGEHIQGMVTLVREKDKGPIPVPGPCGPRGWSARPRAPQ